MNLNLSSQTNNSSEPKDTTSLEVFIIYSYIPLLSFVLFLFQNVHILQRLRARWRLALELLLYSAVPIVVLMVANSPWRLYLLWTMLAATQLILLGILLLPSDYHLKSKLCSEAAWSRLLNFRVTRPGQPLLFFSEFRAGFVIFVAASILAVDFSNFPHRFTKTETYGLGLMDTGVGMFAVINGITSGRQRPRNTASTLSSALPLFVLGVGRTLAVRAVGYNYNPSEYGLHWNFFLTLAVTKVAASEVMSLAPQCPPGLLSVGLAGAYQLLLSLGLQDWLLAKQRGSSFLESNREGLLSLVGFLAIFLAGVELGRWLLQRPRETVKDWLKMEGQLVALSCVLWILTNQLHYHSGLAVSRRLANFSYCLWTIQLCCQGLCLHLGVFLARRGLQLAGLATVPCTYVLAAVDAHLLAHFLLGNLLTGALNLAGDLRNLDLGTSLFILTVYLALLNGGALVLNRLGISSRLR